MGLENIPKKELPAPISLDAYIEFVAELSVVEGNLIEDEIHLFFWWVTKNFAQYQNIDGATLLQLYEINVLETGMTKERFHQYCVDNGFPSPMVLSKKEAKLNRYLLQFDDYVTKLNAQNRVKYETWAEENGIITTPGTVMLFIDTEGNSYKMRTDFEQYGQIVM